MGQSMDSGSDFIQHSLGGDPKGLVDNEEATSQRISNSRGNLKSAIDWTTILKEHGLETPGYHEVIAKMKELGRIKTKPTKVG